MPPKATEEWVLLQRKIFTRWVNQKLAARNEKLDDVVSGFSTGLSLVSLIEILSETKCPLKITANPKLRVNKLDNINNALTYVWKSGVELKLKPSAENICDGEEKQVLGLVWAVMRTFMKFDNDDDQKMGAQDALLMWIQNQTHGYKGVNVQDFGKSFHDGLALCALLHKYRPKLIGDFNALEAQNNVDNLKLAFAAAEKYFGLEQYLTPQDFLKLDDKSMVVYVAEYYYGIARQRKIDLAARRISKLIKLTKTNDALKAEYTEKAKGLRELMDRDMKILGDRTVDNNLAGAKRRLDEFYEFKTKDKAVIVRDYLSVEGLYNYLAMRLADHKRPEFIPAAGMTLKELNETFTLVEKCEQERSVALQKEYNRQLRLVQLNSQHESLCAKANEWVKVKSAYLSTKEQVESSGSAEYHLNALSAYRNESQNMLTRNVGDIKKLGAELLAEKYENSAQVSAREQAIDASFVKLDELAHTKNAILTDDLAREQFKEKVLLDNQQNVDSFEKLKAFIAAKTSYLTTKEHITSIADALTALGVVKASQNEVSDVAKVNVSAFNEVAKSILSAKYETKLSSYTFERPEQVLARQKEVNEGFENLDRLGANKRAVLEDDLLREEFRERLRLLNQQHIGRSEQLKAYITEKNGYLSTKENVTSISEAQLQLSLLEVYQKERNEGAASNLQSLKALGQEIRTLKYESKLSSYSFDQQDAVTARETEAERGFGVLDELYAKKLVVLKDDLERERFRENVRLLNEEHIVKNSKLKSFIAEKEAFLSKKEVIDSISDAQLHLSLLDAYDKEKKSSEPSVQSFQQLATKILESKYETAYSKYAFENPKEIESRVQFINSKWAELDVLAQSKRQVLTDELANEKKKEKLRLQYASSAGDFIAWCRDTTESAGQSHFGFTFPEVEAFDATLAKQDQEIRNDATTRRNTVDQLNVELTQAGVKNNRYTQLTSQDIENSNRLLNEALQKRQSTFQTELSRQRANDNLCKRFAELAEPLAKNVYNFKEKITLSKDSLENQLAFVVERLGANDGASLSDLKALQEEIDKAGVTYNRHTPLNGRDVEVQWNQYLQFLQRKKTMLEEEIQHKKLRGITPEQYQEIEAQFKQYDKNGDGTLDKREFKACLYSLGEEKSSVEIGEIMKKYGSVDIIKYEGFKEFMIEQLGDTDTRDEIKGGFQLINNGAPVAKVDLMELVLPNEDIDYLKQTAKAVDAGLDYSTWTDDVFSR